MFYRIDLGLEKNGLAYSAFGLDLSCRFYVKKGSMYSFYWLLYLFLALLASLLYILSIPFPGLFEYKKGFFFPIPLYLLNAYWLVLRMLLRIHSIMHRIRVVLDGCSLNVSVLFSVLLWRLLWRSNTYMLVHKGL